MGKITIKEIPIAKITLTPDNPRIFKANDPKMQELEESIAAQGVVCPVLVRPLGDGYELRAGERRCRAASAAGLKTIPAVIREMTDDEAFNVTMTENMARQDLTPLEEARGINKYIEHGKTITEVAETLGRSTKYVAQRAQVIRLHTKWMECLTGENPEHDISGWSVPMLTAIARLPEHVQAKVFKDMTEEYYCDLADYDSLNAINQRLADCLLSLRLANFPTGHEYAGCHACAECKKRSSYSPDLFDDDQGDGDDDRCLDRACWEAKEKAFLLETYAKAKEKHGSDLILCATDYYLPRSAREILTGIFGNIEVLESSDYKKVKKSDKGAKPALVVYGNTHLFKVIYIAKGSRAGQSGAAASGGGGKTLEEKIEQNHKLRRRLMVDYLIEGLDAVPKEVITDKKLLVLAYVFGLPWSKTGAWESGQEWAEINSWMDINDNEFSRAFCRNAFEAPVFEMIGKRLKSYGDDPYWGEVKNIAEMFKIDLAPLAERAAQAKPYPKSWKTNDDAWMAGEGWK